MASRTKKIEQKLGYFLFARFQRSFLHKDQLEAERAGAKLGMLLYRLDKKHRSRALSNLALAFPDIPEERRIELAHNCFQHFGRTFADFLRSPARSPDDVLETCPILDLHYIDDALAKGTGVILVTGHFGNWERVAHTMATKGYKVTVVARDANDTGLNREVMKIREHQGIEVLSRGNAARGILRKLKQNEIVAMLTDQNSGDIFIPFFGKPAGTVTGVSSIHLKTGAPLIPIYCRWLSPGRFEGRILPALKPVPGFEPLEGITRSINLSLEEAIRETPEQWLWFHDRWKSARRAGLL